MSGDRNLARAAHAGADLLAQRANLGLATRSYLTIRRIDNGWFVSVSRGIEGPRELAFDTFERLVDWMRVHYAIPGALAPAPAPSPYPRTPQDPFGLLGPRAQTVPGFDTPRNASGD